MISLTSGCPVLVEAMTDLAGQQSAGSEGRVARLP
jgi:hypothetical protein